VETRVEKPKNKKQKKLLREMSTLEKAELKSSSSGSSISGRVLVNIRYFFVDREDRVYVTKLWLKASEESPLEFVPVAKVAAALVDDGIVKLEDIQSARYYDCLDEGFVKLNLGISLEEV